MSIHHPSPTGEPELQATDPRVDAMLEGAVDLHVHPFPSPFPRRMDMVEAARDADRLGYAAILLKSHHHSMVSDVLAVQAAGALDGLSVHVYSGVALNSYVGGLNPDVVELTLSMGGRMIWLPTISSPAQHEHESQGGTFPQASVPLARPGLVSTVDAAGRLKGVVREILEIVRAHDAILNFGHIPAAEVDAVLAAALDVGVEKMVVSHPNFLIGGDLRRVTEWARAGVLVEHEAAQYVTARADRSPRFELSVLESFVGAVGTQATIFGSDCGQAGNTRPVDAFRLLVRALIDMGFTEDEIREMTGRNAATLLASPAHEDGRRPADVASQRNLGVGRQHGGGQR